MIETKVICVTPVKNEAWILNRFLECASLWADHIIIADQNSNDGSKEIAKKYSKVTLIENVSNDFNEPERQKILLEAARDIEGKRIIFALDADEFLTGNFSSSPEWNTLLRADKGTVVQLQWVNLLPNFKKCWITEEDRLFGFVDDGVSEHVGEVIHSPRLPKPKGSFTLSMKDIKVLHYQYTDWLRMQSKHRWYQMWERLNIPKKSSIAIYRRYHHMYSVTSKKLIPINHDWFNYYTHCHHIDMTSTFRPASFWWDIDASKWLEKHTPQHFRKLDIWDYEWSNNIYKEELTKDPRTFFDKLIHSWLKNSQVELLSKSSGRRKIVKLLIKVVDKLLIFLGY